LIIFWPIFSYLLPNHLHHSIITSILYHSLFIDRNCKHFTNCLIHFSSKLWSTSSTILCKFVARFQYMLLSTEKYHCFSRSALAEPASLLKGHDIPANNDASILLWFSNIYFPHSRFMFICLHFIASICKLS
jgi:hypothetical protein